MIYSRTRVRSRRVLENVFRVHSVEVLEAIINCWNRDKMVRLCTFQIRLFLTIFRPSAARTT